MLTVGASTIDAALSLASEARSLLATFCMSAGSKVAPSAVALWEDVRRIIRKVAWRLLTGITLAGVERKK
jgi:hypothetical protein